MKCPECGHKIAPFKKTCPTCGFPLNNFSKFFPLVSLVFVFLIMASALNYSDAKPVIDAIDSIGIVTLESENTINAAQNMYDHLNPLQKLFVFNHSTLSSAKEEFDSLPVVLTPANARSYFDFNVIFSNLVDKDNSIYLLGIFQHSASANMEVVCSPKKDCYYENVSITLRYDLGSIYKWTAPDITIHLDSMGKGSHTEKITYHDMLSPSLPDSTSKFIITNASGKIYKQKSH